jgi:hypothetical protein
VSRQGRANALFLLVGGLLLIVSFLATPPTQRDAFWTSTIQNFGLIALTVVIVDALWTIVGGDPVGESIGELRTTLDRFRQSIKLLDDSHKTGLRRVVAASGAFGSTEDWMTRLASARAQVDLMGYTLHVLTRGPNFEAVIRDLVRREVAIRLLVMAADSPKLPAFVNHAQIPGLTVDTVTAELAASTAAFRALRTAVNSPRFELRAVHDGMIVTQIVRVDGTITSIQYLYSAVASRNPIFEVQGESSDLFRCYAEEFERLWESAVSI